MLFRIEFVDTNMIYLNEVLKHFILNAVLSNQYRKARLFPTEFIVVHDNKKNAVDKHFKAVFEQIKILNPELKKQLKRMYFNHQRTKRLCQDSVEIVNFTDYPDKFKKALKALGEYLYTSGLKNSQIRGLAVSRYGDVNSTIHEHWLAFKRVNGSVCAFCGIQDYEEQLPDESDTKWRPAYDHYLPKEKYPLAAVNFKNLIPCCYQCNSKSKGAVDPCNCNNLGRKKARYPFSTDMTLGLKLKFVKENVAANKPWLVELRDELDDAHQTWNRVYKIKDRVTSRLNADYTSWLLPYLDECSRLPDIASKKEILLQKAKVLAKFAKQNREYVHQANLLASLAITTSDEITDSILSSITPDQDPDNLKDGIDLLNAMGFSLVG